MVRAYKTKTLACDNRGYFRRDLGVDSDGNQPRFVLGRDEQQALLRKARLEALWAIIESDGGGCCWDAFTLAIGKAVARGEVMFGLPRPPGAEDGAYAAVVSQYAVRYRSVIAILPEDQAAFANGVQQNQHWHKALTQSVTATVNGAAAVVGLDVKIDDIFEAETGTLHQALDAYQAEFERDTPKLPGGILKQFERKRIERVARLKATHQDMPLYQLTKDKIAETISYWRNRPPTKKGTPCSTKHAKHHRDEFDRFLGWLDAASRFKWMMPRGAEKISRKIIRFDHEKKLTAVTKIVYSPEQLATLNSVATDFDRMILYLALNCAMGAAEAGRVFLDDCVLFQTHPHAKKLQIPASNQDSWLRYFRPKTSVFGEWYLWPETVEMIEWGKRRAKGLKSKHLICRASGNPLYDESLGNPQSGFANLWTRLRNRAIAKDGNLPKLPFGSLRDTLPDHLRHEYSSELASICLTHGIPTNIESADDLLDLYSNRPFGRLHAALKESRDYYAPVFKHHVSPK